MSTTINVSSASELSSALASASGGETILLASGDYGSVQLSNLNFNQDVTIQSADGAMGAVFDSISVTNSSHIHIDNVHVSNPGNGSSASKIVAVNSSSHITVSNSEVNGLVDGNYEGHYGLYAGGGSSNVRFENNYVHDVRQGSVTIGVNDIEVVGNTFDYIGEDAMKLGSNNGVLVQNNTGLTNSFPIPGAHVDFIQFQAASQNVVIDGNWYLGGTNIYVQGILFGFFDHDNVLIENNLIHTGMIHGITVEQGTNIVARNNTVLNIPGEGHGATKILLNSGGIKENNVTVSHDGDQGVLSGNNYQLQNNNPNASLYVDHYIQNGSAGLGVTLEDLRPVAGSPIDFGSGIGAEARLAELLNGGGSGSAPDAGDDSAVVVEDGSLTISGQDLLSNDSDPDGDPLTIVSVTNGANGAVVLNPDGSVTYTPNTDFFGQDSFQYTVSDGNGRTDTASVTVTIGGTPDTPFAGDDARILSPGEASIINVLGNDTDPDGDSLEVVSVTQGERGSVAINSDGTLTYTPPVWFVGSDSFSYTVSDGNGGTDTATVNVVVAPFPTPVFDLQGEQSFDGGVGDVINLQHDASLEIAQGTIAFSFVADDVSTRQGLVSKDAADFAGGGNHLAVYVENGALNARFQDGSSSTLLFDGPIVVGEKYEVAVTFGPDGVSLYVDGSLVDTNPELVMSWLTNQEYLQIGALGWGSQTGQGDFVDPFDGSIADFQIYNQVLDTSQIQQLSVAPITGTEGNDDIVGSNDGNVINGLGGDDSLFGQDGADEVSGGAGNDLVNGGNGADGLYGGVGNDALSGGWGNDRLFGQDGNDNMWAGGGDDLAEGGNGSDNIWGGFGKDTLSGGLGDDKLYGQDAGDNIWGGAGNDTLDGGNGWDNLWSGLGNDVLSGGYGNDRLYGQEGGDKLWGNSGDDTVDGGSGWDSMWGGDGNDVLSGSWGNDNLYGQDGADTLNGGRGNDYLLGGSGNDTFVFTPGDGNDTLGDFVAGAGSDDVIDVSAFTQSSLSEILNLSSQSGDDVVINLDAGTSLTLLGVNVADLSEDDFLFA